VLRFEFERTDSRSCPMVGFGNAVLKTSGSVTKESVATWLHTVE
jgi:hypothetical protein